MNDFDHELTERLQALRQQGLLRELRRVDVNRHHTQIGALFGLAVDPRVGVYFVDDATNTLNLLQKR